MTAVTITAQGYGNIGRTKTCACASTKGEGVTQRTMAHDFASRRGGSCRPRLKTRGVQLAISVSQMTDRSATIYPSLAEGKGDDAYTLIWSRRNGD